VDLVKDGGVELNATFLFMRPLESHIALSNLPPPVVTSAPGELPQVFHGDNLPVFVRKFENYPAIREPGPEPVECQWVRLLDRKDMDGASELLMIGDFSPPGFMRRIVTRGPMCSMTWQANFLGDLPDIGDGYWLVRTIGHYTENGANSQLMQVWDDRGNPVVAGQQSTALFC